MTFPPDLPVLWQHPLGGRSLGRGERAGDLFLQPAEDQLHAIDVRDGATRWIADGQATVVAADADHVVLVPLRGTWGTHSLVGLSTRTGDVAWTAKLAGNVAPNGRANRTRSELLRAGDRAFVQVWGLPDVPGAQLWELELATGIVRSRRAIPRGAYPVSDGRAVYAASAERPTVWIFDGTDEREIDVRSSAYSLAVAGDRLLTWHKGDRELRVWHVGTGRWLHSFAGADTLPALDDELLVVPLKDAVAAFDLATGQERWRSSLDGSRVQRECSFLREYVANCVGFGHLLRRSDGEVIVRDEWMSDPRPFDDATLWVRENTLYRLV